MADEELLAKIHSLGDLDLAALLCFIAREHCIISTEPAAIDQLIEELQLVASNTFGLTSAVLACTPHTRLDDFAAGILLDRDHPHHDAASVGRTTPAGGMRTPSPLLQQQNRNRGSASGQDSYFTLRPQGHHDQHHNANRLSPLSFSSGVTPTHHPAPRIANIVLARDLDLAPKAIQIQALELLRTRRIFTKTSVQPAPKQFLFIAVIGSERHSGETTPRLTRHLNDYFYISHWHDPLDGFAHLDEQSDGAEAGESGEEGEEDARGDQMSIQSAESVVRRSVAGSPRPQHSSSAQHARSGSGSTGLGLITDGDIARLALSARNRVAVDVELLRYQQNIIAFLRVHRAVAVALGPGGGGVSGLATRHFEFLASSLATLHGLDYVTPGLVALAARKIYRHRIRIVEPGRERSVQWGSRVESVREMLEGVGPEDVIDDVLSMVGAPL